jgi:hypothetical protein
MTATKKPVTPRTKKVAAKPAVKKPTIAELQATVSRMQGTIDLLEAQVECLKVTLSDESTLTSNLATSLKEWENKSLWQITCERFFAKWWF